ncbi:glycosyltransferase [Microbacterium caowuchunii]|uniref:4,4'-diaponeurosporenoate glycosyltransferase n=1 Tax=Microbacterium caowuchunii TaxID=2614638 RepID=A0A5N0T9W4_9MICO|nr:glycosyltransferase [Microbacterium caowuchunii]KAA9131752.1 glycosyltransferase [Microbacterium caowuchunii]
MAVASATARFGTRALWGPRTGFRDAQSADGDPVPDGAVTATAPPLRRESFSERPVQGAVIIPAHNESAVIARSLRCLRSLAVQDGVEVIVACNGCTDDTARIARGFAGVQVVETDVASKTAALNLGDRIATVWPRLYLDADIEIEPSAVVAVFDALAAPGILAARPQFVYDLQGATFPVRAYYRARNRIGGPPRMWGAGGYAASEEGHRRFGSFASVTADDSWFDEQFSESEKVVVATAPLRVRTPRNRADLIAVLTRQRRGYRELGVASSAAARLPALLRGIRGPRSAVDAAWYVVLTVMAWRRAAITMRTGTPGWERDASTRRGEEVSP